MVERLICTSEAVQERSLAYRFKLEYHGRERNAIVIRYGGHVYAYINECAHVPIELDYNLGDVFDLSREFLICSTHGAYYNPRNGLCLGGPCTGRRLQALTISEHDEAIWLIEEMKNE
ncbi:Rieske (2Fe-2S) protein [Deefgea rivuli]|uniref:Rieske (2Fe-2S) protein n=1 Tax=Deefgea rivuli TaxID=400948 RepID=UPI000482AD6A|nr:Rieske 2Fe-2S domain-containing protein [Deefgea rivuli]